MLDLLQSHLPDSSRGRMENPTEWKREIRPNGNGKYDRMKMGNMTEWKWEI